MGMRVEARRLTTRYHSTSVREREAETQVIAEKQQVNSGGRTYRTWKYSVDCVG